VIDALDTIAAMWANTIERARRLPEAKLHERVEGEYSFVETLRHLLFATDAWVTRMVLRVPNAYHEWSVIPDDRSMSGGPGRLRQLGWGDEDSVPNPPPDDGPTLDEVLAVRNDRLDRLRAHLLADPDADLRAKVDAPDPNGFPQGSWPIIDCIRLLLSEEWWHHHYAARDLASLEDSREERLGARPNDDGMAAAPTATGR
jgi:hypothetical protein